MGRQAYLVAWAKSQKFLRNYPNSPARASLEATCKQIRPRVEAAVPDGAKAVDQLIANKDWARFGEALAIMEEAPLPPALADSLARWQAQRDGLAGEAEVLFNSLSDKENAAAKESDECGRRSAGKKPSAARCWRWIRTTSRLWPFKTKLTKRQKDTPTHFLRERVFISRWTKGHVSEELEEVLRLDPNGRFGQQARAMLASLEKE